MTTITKDLLEKRLAELKSSPVWDDESAGKRDGAISELESLIEILEE